MKIKQPKTHGIAEREPVIPEPVHKEHRIRMSYLPRYLECPGAYAVEQQVEDTTSPAAESGTKIHKILQLMLNKATLSDYDLLLDAKEAQCAFMNCDEREAFVVGWFADEIYHVCEAHGGVKNVYKEFEVELPIIDGIVGIGHPDILLECNDGTWHEPDYKTGRLAVDTAEKNLQIQAYAIATALKFGLVSITAHILSAGNDDGITHTESTYHQGHLKALYSTIMEIASNCTKEHAPRIPGEKACKYCKGMGTTLCPEHKLYIDRASRMGVKLSVQDAMFKGLDDAEIGEAIEKAKLCEGWAKKLLAEAKTYVKNTPSNATGWTLGKGRKSTSWKSPRKAVKAIIDSKMLTPRQIAKASGVSVAQVIKEYTHKEELKAKREGVKAPKKNDVRNMVHDLLKGHIVESVGEGSLQKL